MDTGHQIRGAPGSGRAGETAEQDQLRARHRLSKFLLRTGSGQRFTRIVRYRADFGGNHCGGVEQYLG